MTQPAIDPTLFTIGDIAVGRFWIVTPYGSAPMSGSTWYVQDRTFVEQTTPSWAIVCAVVGFFFVFVFSLFFLLVKETTVRGHVEVTVISGGLHHVAHLGASNSAQLAQIHNMVAHAQQLAVSAPPVN